MDFEDIASLPALRQLCGMFCRLTGLPFHLLDVNGAPSEKYVSRQFQNPFCRLIQRVSAGENKCKSSGQEQCRRLTRKIKPSIYRCHAGLIDIDVPIIIRGNCLGHVCSGSVLLKKPVSRDLKHLNQYGRYAARLKQAYRRSPVVPAQTLQAIADLLLFIANYIVEAEDKINFLTDHVSKYDPIVKAREYLRGHYREKISLADIARVGALSPSRFDHVFKEKTGQTFVHYLQDIRLEKAKLLLASSSLRIVEIALEVGFISPGHFNRTFREREGLSPREYRKQSQFDNKDQKYSKIRAD